MQDYTFAYVCSDGRPKTFHTKANTMFDAARKFETFMTAMFKKNDSTLDALSIASLSIIPTPKKGRKAKK